MGVAARTARLGRAALLSACWGIGVALGLALGSYLTVVSGAGAPGVSSLSAGDVLTLPLASGLVVTLVFFGGHILLGLRTRPSARSEHEPQKDSGGAENDEIAGDVGREVESPRH